MKIGRIRKKLREIKFVEKQLSRLRRKDEELNDFIKFECSEFFRGEKTAKHNREIANRERDRIDRHYRFLSKMLDKRSYGR